MEKTKKTVITINRQLGSGGAYLGQRLAEKLDIFYADREIIIEAAKQLSVQEEEVASYDEKRPTFWESFLQTRAFVPDVYDPQKNLAPTDRELFETEAGIIQRIAKDNSAVIIGRCGFDVLKDNSGIVKIFLYADNEFRAERIQKMYNISKEEARKMMVKSDKERAIYVKTFTGKEWEDARNYDISINTGKIGLDNAVEFILDYLKYRK